MFPFDLAGFGSFGADPFAHEEEEEDQPGAGGEDEAAEAGGEQQPASTDKEADEGVELIATDDDSHQDSTYGTHQDTIIEEEEPEEDTGAADEGDKSLGSDDQTKIASVAEDDGMVYKVKPRHLTVYLPPDFPKIFRCHEFSLIHLFMAKKNGLSQECGVSH